MRLHSDLERLNTEIQLIKKSANTLKSLGDSFPAVTRNALRILASTKMLEINISDVVEFSEVP